MAAAVPDDAVARFLHQAGLVTIEQIEKAQAVKVERSKAGMQVSLADVFVEQGTLTAQQRENVLKKLEALQAGGIRQLGQYKLLKKLGEGGMGAVYLAQDINVDRKVALKILPKKYADDRVFLTRFRREAQTTGRLNHVNIVCAYALGEDLGQHYYAMEYCEGEPLDSILKRQKTVDWHSATAVILQVARGLKHAHDHGVLHRDIKPANIFIGKPLGQSSNAPPGGPFDDGFVAKILDLGLSKCLSGGEQSFTTQTGMALGTPHYISPEQARADKDIDGRTDIYSLGATYYHLLTGQTPFNGSTGAVVMLKHLNEELPNPQDINEAIPDGVAHVIARMMAKEPADRYRDCAELLADLEQIIVGLPPQSGAMQVGKSSVAVRKVRPVAGRRHAGAPVAKRPGQHTAVPKTGSRLAVQVLSGVLAISLVGGGIYIANGGKKNTPEVVQPKPHETEPVAKSASPVAEKKPPVTTPVSSALTTLPQADVPIVAAKPVAIEPGFVPLFDANGIRDWKQWGTEAGKNAAWAFSNGVLSCRYSGRGNAIFYDKDLDLANFELRFAVRMGAGKPSLQFRTETDNSGHALRYFRLDPKNTKWKGTTLWMFDNGEKPLAAYGEYVRLTRTAAGFAKTIEVPGKQNAMTQLWKDDDWNEVTLVADGTHITEMLNGTVVADLSDDPASTMRTGGLAFALQNDQNGELSGEFKDIRIRRLPPASAASATTVVTGTTGGSYPQPAKWIDATAEVRSAGLKQEALAVDGDWLETRKGVTLPLGDGRRFGNVAVRIVYANAMDVCLRESGRKYFGHVLWHAAIGLTEATIGSAKSKDLKGDLELPAGYKDKTEHELVFAAQGDVLSLWIDGREKATVRDGTLDAGTMSVVLTPGNNKEYKPSRIRKVEYGELAAATATVAPAPPSTEPWQDVLHGPDWKLELYAGAKKTPDGLLIPGGGMAQLRSSEERHDGGIRLRTKLDDAPVDLRARSTVRGDNYFLRLSRGKPVALYRWNSDTNRDVFIRDFPLPAQFATGLAHELELRVVGQTFTVKLDGAVLGTATDAVIDKGRFSVGVYSKAAPAVLIESLDFLDLDAPATTTPPPSIEAWQDALRDPAKLALNGGVERTQEGLRFSRQGTATFHGGRQGAQRDGAARMRAIFGGLRPQLLARGSKAGGCYQLFVNPHSVQMAFYSEVAKQWKSLREFPLREPLQPGQAYELELRAVGQVLTAKFNGEVLGTVTDATLTEGEFSVGVADHDMAPVLVKAFDVLDLDAPGGPSATPATTYPQPAKWTDATQWLRANNSGPDGFLVDGEWLHLAQPAKMFKLTPGQQFRNAIVRVRYSHRVDIALRRVRNGSDDLRYEAGIGPATANIGMTRPVGSQASNLLTPIVKLAASYRPEQEHEAVFAAQGSTLTLWIDGQQIATTQDSTLPSGEITFMMKNDAQYGNCRIKKVEYGELPDTSATASPAASGGGWISLMDKIDPAKDSVQGTWTRVADGMFGEDSNRFGHLQLPYHPPEEYDFRIVFTPKAGSGQAEQILAVGGHQFRWKQAGGYEDHFRAAFDAVDGKKFLDSPAYAKLSEPPLLNRRYESIVEVRRNRVTGYVDGKKLVEWPTDYHEMSIAADFAIPDTHALGIGLYSGKTTFHDISVREVTGTGKLLRGAATSPAVSALPVAATENWTDWLAERRRDRRLPVGVVWKGDSIEVVDEKVFFVLGPAMKNGAVRVTATRGTARSVQIFLRCENPEAKIITKDEVMYSRTYRMQDDAGGCVFMIYRDAKDTKGFSDIGGRLWVQNDSAKPHVMEFRVIGTELAGWFDGNPLATGANSALTQGVPAFFAYKGALIHKIEVLNMDAHPPSAPAAGK